MKFKFSFRSEKSVQSLNVFEKMALILEYFYNRAQLKKNYNCSSKNVV